MVTARRRTTPQGPAIREHQYPYTYIRWGMAVPCRAFTLSWKPHRRPRCQIICSRRWDICVRSRVVCGKFFFTLWLIIAMDFSYFGLHVSVRNFSEYRASTNEFHQERKKAHGRKKSRRSKIGIPNALASSRMILAFQFWIFTIFFKRVSWQIMYKIDIMKITKKKM